VEPPVDHKHVADHGGAEVLDQRRIFVCGESNRRMPPISHTRAQRETDIGNSIVPLIVVIFEAETRDARVFHPVGKLF
jgi:hypothetical protein